MTENRISIEYDREDALDAVVTALVEVEPTLFALRLGALDSIEFEKVAEAARVIDRLADLRAGKNVATQSGPDGEDAALLADLVILLRDDPEFRRFALREIGQFVGEIVSAPFKALFSLFEGLFRGFFG
jgi:hypothetical protein